MSGKNEILVFCLVTCDDILPIKISSTLESNIRNNRYEKELEWFFVKSRKGDYTTWHETPWWCKKRVRSCEK